MRKFKAFLSIFVCAMLLMTDIPMVKAAEVIKPILILTSSKEDVEINDDESIIIEGFTVNADEVNILVDGKKVQVIEGKVSQNLNDEYTEYSDEDKDYFSYEVQDLSSGKKNITVEAVSSDGQKAIENFTVNKINSQKDDNVNKSTLNTKAALSAITSIDSIKNDQYFGASDIYLKGWAINKSGIKEINVLVDGKTIGKATLGISRPDVNKVFPGYPNGSNSGYDFIIPITEVQGKDRTITVEAIGNDGSKNFETRRLKNRPVNMSLDNPLSNTFHTNANVNVEGWALNNLGIKQVNILIDGKVIGQATLGIKRADVNKAFPGYPNGDSSGYRFTIPITELQGKDRAVTVEAIGNDGSKQSRSVTIKKKASVMSIDEPMADKTFNGDIKVRGWALNSSGVRKVEVEVDGKLVGEATLGALRPDVNKAFPGYPNGGNSGYDFTIPYSAVQGANRMITVRAVGSDGTTMAKTVNIKMQGVVESKGTGVIDIPSNNQNISSSNVQIAGWAIHSKGVKEVRIFVNNKQVATTVPSGKRDDVNKIYPSYPGSGNSGFSVSVSKNLIPNGSNTIKIEIIGADNTIFTATRNFNMNKPVSRISIDSPAERQTYPVGQDLVVKGWSINDSSIEKVEVLLNGNTIGNATIGLSRPDVNNAFPGYPNGSNSGYTFRIKANQLTQGTHSITVRSIGKDGGVISETRTLYYGVTYKKTIVIDPGHNNGGDEGAISNGYYERILNMEVADKLRNKLIATGYNVIMTREVGEVQTDALSVSLQRRVRIANQANADLFISIHHNVASATSANGIEVWYSSNRTNPNAQISANSATLSRQLVDSLSALGYTNRGAKDGNLYVTKNTNMTSVLLELGFISNKSEADKCANPVEQDRKATAITNVVKNFLK